MIEYNEYGPERKNVKIISWILLVLSVLKTLGAIIGIISTIVMFSTDIMQHYSNIPYTEEKLKTVMALGILMNVITLLLGLVILVSTLNTLKYKEWARNLLLRALPFVILFILVKPLLSFYFIPDLSQFSVPNIPVDAIVSFSIIISYIFAIGASIVLGIIMKYLNKDRVKHIFRNSM